MREEGQNGHESDFTDKRQACQVSRTSQPVPEQLTTAYRLAPHSQIQRLVLLVLLLLFAIHLLADFLVVTLKRGEILTRLAELSFFHTFSNVPVHESTLRVQEIELRMATQVRVQLSG